MTSHYSQFAFPTSCASSSRHVGAISEENLPSVIGTKSQFSFGMVPSVGAVKPSLKRAASSKTLEMPAKRKALLSVANVAPVLGSALGQIKEQYPTKLVRYFF